MSMPIIKTPEDPIDREQSVNDLIESVALMETGLSHILNAEGEKIQKVIKHDEGTDVPLEDILKVNDSAQNMVNSISKLEMILQNKLDSTKALDIVGMPGPPGPMGPAGPQGEQGIAATIEIGTVTPVAYADSYVVNVGSPTAAVLDFGIPTGPAGPQGEQGPKGEKGEDAVLPVLEHAFFYSTQEQVVGNRQRVKFNVQTELTSNITYNDGFITINKEGLYYISYEIYPSTGSSPTTIFSLFFTGSHSSPGSTRFNIDNKFITASIFMRVTSVPLQFAVDFMGPNQVTIPANGATGARLIIQQIE